MAKRSKKMKASEVFSRVLDEVSGQEAYPVCTTSSEGRTTPFYLYNAASGHSWTAMYSLENILNGDPDLRRPVNNYFTHPLLQVVIIAYWNYVRDWGLSLEDFQGALNAIPPWPAERGLTAVTLAPYLAPNKASANEVWRTFNELWTCAKHRREWNSWNFTPGQLMLRKGVMKYAPGLRWEVIAFDSNIARAPSDVEPKLLPHAGLMAALVNHPLWIERMSCKREVPAIWISGYCIASEEELVFRNRAPFVRIHEHRRNIELDVANDSCTKDMPTYAVPTFVELE